MQTLTDELNILGVLVHARPEDQDRIRALLTAQAGVEVHACAGGRMVVTIETADSRDAGATLQGLYSVEGVLAASLVYQHCDAVEAAAQEA